MKKHWHDEIEYRLQSPESSTGRTLYISRYCTNKTDILTRSFVLFYKLFPHPHSLKFICLSFFHIPRFRTVHFFYIWLLALPCVDFFFISLTRAQSDIKMIGYCFSIAEIWFYLISGKCFVNSGVIKSILIIAIKSFQNELLFFSVFASCPDFPMLYWLANYYLLSCVFIDHFLYYCCKLCLVIHVSILL